MDLLKRHKDGQNSRAVNGVIRRAADAITNLAHENSSIKTRVRFVCLHHPELQPRVSYCFCDIPTVYSGLNAVYLPLLNCLSLLMQKCREQLQELCEPLPLKMMKIKIRLVDYK